MDVKSFFQVYQFTGSILDELKGKVVTLGINKKFGLMNTDGTMKGSTFAFLVEVTRANSRDVTTIPQSEIVGGQIQFAVPNDATSFAFCFTPSTYSDAALINPIYQYNNPNLVGMWIVS